MVDGRGRSHVAWHHAAALILSRWHRLFHRGSCFWNCGNYVSVGSLLDLLISNSFFAFPVIVISSFSCLLLSCFSDVSLFSVLCFFAVLPCFPSPLLLYLLAFCFVASWILCFSPSPLVHLLSICLHLSFCFLLCTAFCFFSNSSPLRCLFLTPLVSLTSPEFVRWRHATLRRVKHGSTEPEMACHANSDGVATYSNEWRACAWGPMQWFAALGIEKGKEVFSW